MPKKKLSEIHKQKRRDFVISHVPWTSDDWVQVVFTNEKQWSLAGNDGFISIWTENKQNPLEMTETNQKGGLMVWGAIAKNGWLHLISSWTSSVLPPIAGPEETCPSTLFLQLISSNNLILLLPFLLLPFTFAKLFIINLILPTLHSEALTKRPTT